MKPKQVSVRRRRAISGTGYRSTEAIAGDDTGTQGWNPFTQTSFSVYNLTPVPEPSTLAFLGIGAVAGLCFLRQRK